MQNFEPVAKLHGSVKSPEQKQAFCQNLIQAMEADLTKDRGGDISTKLGMDYSPDPGALYEAFQKTGLDIRCNSLLPYKGLTYLTIKENRIEVNVWLKGPLF